MNVKICGFGTDQDGIVAAVEMLSTVEKCLVGMDNCWIAVVPSLSGRAGAKKNPHLEIVYERKDAASGQVKNIVKRLKNDNVNLPIEFHRSSLIP